MKLCEDAADAVHEPHGHDCPWRLEEALRRKPQASNTQSTKQTNIQTFKPAGLAPRRRPQSRWLIADTIKHSQIKKQTKKQTKDQAEHAFPSSLSGWGTVDVGGPAILDVLRKLLFQPQLSEDVGDNVVAQAACGLRCGTHARQQATQQKRNKYAYDAQASYSMLRCNIVCFITLHHVMVQ
jgi:hypothetical protein